MEKKADPNARCGIETQAGATLPPVIDMRVRPHVTRYLDVMGRGLARIGATPTFMTVLGLAVVLAGSVVIASGRLASGALLVAGGSLLDGLDGAVARATDQVSARGAFLDSVFDRLGEVAAFAALAFVQAGEARQLLLIVVAIGGAMLVPYVRARAEAVGLDGRGGLMGRSERLIVFCVGLVFFPDYIEAMLWVFVALVWLTVIVRFTSTYRSIE